jgi:hypothetical protein
MTNDSRPGRFTPLGDTAEVVEDAVDTVDVKLVVKVKLVVEVELADEVKLVDAVDVDAVDVKLVVGQARS